MRLVTTLLLAVAASAFGGVAMAAASPLAIAEAVQPPAWVERGGSRSALLAGHTLREGDRLVTGAGGRLHIGMADGSVVKLGENGQLELPRLRAHVEDGGLLSGALQVARGAFRFTTRALGRLQRREIDVAIGPTITAGIRGTDIWGRSDREQELLCLIEGMIEIGGPGQARQVMDQPLTFYVVPRDQPALPVASAPAGQLERWTAQTELNPDRPAMSAEGGYMVGLESHLAADAAHAAVTRLDERGYAAEVVRAAIAGQTWYRVVLSGFGSAAEAARFAAEARSSLGLQSPWVIAPDNL